MRGTCTSEEKEQVERYLEQEKDLSVFEAALESQWTDMLGQTPPAMDMESSLQRFKTKRRQLDTSQTRQRRWLHDFIYKYNGHKYSLIGAFFMLLVILSGIVVGYMYWYRSGNAVNWKEIVTANGQQVRITLPDGSHVWLQAGSKVKFPEVFSGESRPVWLSGAALFEVKRDEHLPFVVHTLHLTTSVLGTSFYMKAYEDEPEEEVLVTTGKVMVESKKLQGLKPVVLQMQQRVIYQKENGEIHTDSMDVIALEAFQEHRLYLKDMHFSEIARTLERWYDVEIEFENNALLNCQFSATFDRIALPEVLDRLRMVSPFTYTIKGKKVLISGKQCN